jgi:hypothetical protein
VRAPIVDDILAIAVFRRQASAPVKVMVGTGTTFVAVTLAEIVGVVTVVTVLLPGSLTVTPSLVAVTALFRAIAIPVATIVASIFTAIALCRRRLAQHERSAKPQQFE